jgi:hypothetical protein
VAESPNRRARRCAKQKGAPPQERAMSRDQEKPRWRRQCADAVCCRDYRSPTSRSHCSITTTTDQVHGWGFCEEESAPVARHPPTPELRDLLGQLLDVTRHRAAFANSARKPDKLSLAARIDSVAARRGETLSVKSLSALAKASTGSISAWRRSPTTRRSWKRRKRTFSLPPPRYARFLNPAVQHRFMR